MCHKTNWVWSVEIADRDSRDNSLVLVYGFGWAVKIGRSKVVIVNERGHIPFFHIDKYFEQ